MVTWIVVAVLVLALLVLVLSVGAVLGRLTGLQRAVRKVQLRQEQAVGLQRRVEVTQAALEAVQERVELAAQQAEVIRAGQGRHDERPSFLVP